MGNAASPLAVLLTAALCNGCAMRKASDYAPFILHPSQPDP